LKNISGSAFKTFIRAQNKGGRQIYTGATVGYFEDLNLVPNTASGIIRTALKPLAIK
jgi:hypothetical protein